MSGAVPPQPLYAFMKFTETTLPFYLCFGEISQGTERRLTFP